MYNRQLDVAAYGERKLKALLEKLPSLEILMDGLKMIVQLKLQTAPAGEENERPRTEAAAEALSTSTAKPTMDSELSADAVEFVPGGYPMQPPLQESNPNFQFNAQAVDFVPQQLSQTPYQQPLPMMSVQDIPVGTQFVAEDGVDGMPAPTKQQPRMREETLQALKMQVQKIGSINNASR
jgi:hypothetical protein